MKSNPKTPWRKTDLNRKDKGGHYDNPSDDALDRGRIRREIEDKKMQQELNDDPLFGGE